MILSSRPSIKELANAYNISRYLMTDMLIESGVMVKKGKKGNRGRLYPMDVHLLMQRFGAPVKS